MGITMGDKGDWMFHCRHWRSINCWQWRSIGNVSFTIVASVNIVAVVDIVATFSPVFHIRETEWFHYIYLVLSSFWNPIDNCNDDDNGNGGDNGAIGLECWFLKAYRYWKVPLLPLKWWRWHTLPTANSGHAIGYQVRHWWLGAPLAIDPLSTLAIHWQSFQDFLILLPEIILTNNLYQ